MRTALGMWIVTAVVLAASTASAMDPATRCQVAKLKSVAKYTACRLKAEADAAKRRATPLFDRCIDSFDLAWQLAEDRAMAAGTSCWSTGDAASVRSSIDSHTTSLASSLSYETRDE